MQLKFCWERADPSGVEELKPKIRTTDRGMEKAIQGLQSAKSMRTVMDPMEDVRQPVIDRWVLNPFNRKRGKLEHFEARDGGVYLNHAAFKALLKLFQEYLGQYGEGARWQDRTLKRVDVMRDAVLDGTALPEPEWPDGGD